jgi:hypothetical protein
MYNRHIIGAEYLKPPCQLSLGIKEITGESITVKTMWAQFDQLTIIDDVPVRQLEGLKTKLQVIVPITERRTILSFRIVITDY